MRRSWKATCPASRRVFKHSWDELAYLCDKATYHLHMVCRRGGATRFVPRMARVLGSIDDPDGAIVTEVARSLICEYDRQWARAILHRRKEVELILRMYGSFTDDQGQDVRRWALKDYTKCDVIERLIAVRRSYVAHANASEVASLTALVDRVEVTREP